MNVLRNILALTLMLSATLGTSAFAANAESIDPRFPNDHVIDVSSDEAVANLTPEEIAAIEEEFGPLAPVAANAGPACFDYYRFNSVQVIAGAEQQDLVPGIPLALVGSIVNENAYPLSDVQVYAKVFKLDSARTEANVLANGNPVVDFVQVADDVTLPANGELPFSYSYKLPHAMEAGKYRIAFFVTVAERYNMLGLTFTDDVIGNVTDFSVTAATSPVPAFDKDSVTLNGTPYNFASFPPIFEKDEQVVMTAKLVNPLAEEVSVTLTHKLYSWDALREETVRDSVTEVVKLKPREVRTVSYTATAADSTSYLMTTATYKDAKSIIAPRFGRSGLEDMRINFPGITSYPLQAGVENTLFSCVHAIDTTVKDATLTLTLTSPEGAVLHTYTYSGAVTGAMMAAADKFTPTANYTDFDLTATLTKNGTVVESVTIPYRCAVLDASLCPEPEAPAPVVEIPLNTMIIIGLIVLALVLGLLLIWGLRRKSAPTTLMCLIGVVGIGVLSLHVSSGLALEVHTSQHAFTTNYLAQSSTHKSVITQSAPVAVNRVFGNAYLVNVVSANAIYRATVSQPEGTVIQNSAIAVGHPRTNEETSWYQTGSRGDTPYGCWSDMRWGRWNCTNELIFSQPTLGRRQFGNVFNVPSVTVQGTGSISCSGNNCTASGLGAGTIRLDYAQNVSTASLYLPKSDRKFIVAYIPLPAKTIVFNYNVVTPNQPPTTPVVTSSQCGASIVEGTSVNLSMRATDPNNDQLRYQIAWLGGGVVNENVPASGYVPSGTEGKASRVFDTAGTYPIQTRAQDNRGGVSAWSNCTVTVTAAPVAPTPSASVPPTVTLTASVDNDSFTEANRTIDVGDVVRLQWDGEDADTCTSSDFTTGGAVDGIDPNVVEPTLGTSKVYTVTCTRGSETASDTLTITARGNAPTLTPNDLVVKAGGRTVIAYDLKGNTECTFSSADTAFSGLSVTQNGTKQTGALSSATRYILTCEGGIATAIINVTGTIIEQ
ncbi:hypothetical protein A3C89_02755 [Candidatus Kaiserbacteria bacterium RIFCSPHIGHO2_02_FULL_50_50]|uniref:Ig-like domain-containing protein n=1 Tax=Candidatus Kaiserbacteria bacterium RIFCSPHIGHO2_02_FULL_50_50 TaxID=1798492 RepID=A0A1F6DDB5_9BACT|nr:MAG: hypothetical protein A3C89_02755 [Candidatus Kaiserbacteria bacterium RIFCSPHIGHO2_02_FULL_50_50]OGG89149.1 MAG: hypothetical protein A3G62_00175 [Candidatus Kaiserbacteria bacterium RIFCSPLOWO2_12_FULL_50_10]